MHLYDLPLVFAGIGLVLYTVLAGADFGAGFWQLFSGPGQHGERIRDHAEGKVDHPAHSSKVVALVWHEPHADEKSAATREAQIKHWGHNQKACLAHSTPPYDTMGEATWVPLDAAQNEVK